ncbi:MAG: hypothetical protein AAGJ74_14860 [Pseudomonadota bacterium]
MSARGTRTNRSPLEAMNAGGIVAAGGMRDVTVIAVGDRATAEQYLSGPDDETVVLAHVDRKQA